MAGQIAEKSLGHVSLCVCATVSEIGDAENISKSYVSRILRLALLAPDIIDAILAGRRAQSIVLDQLEWPLPATWDEQRRLVSTASMEGALRRPGAQPAQLVSRVRARRWLPKGIRHHPDSECVRAGSAWRSDLRLK